MKNNANIAYVLNLAPNGIVPTKELTPFVPITPEEVLADLEACMKVGGLTYLHLHARDKNGEPSSDKSEYAKFIEPIRTRYKDLVICVSCSGRLNPSFESRSEVLELTGDLKPEMASLTLSSLNFSKSASINTPDTIIRLAEKMGENSIVPELEIFDLGMMNFAHYMIKKGYLKPPYYFNILLGNIFSAQAKASHLASILAELPSDSIWSLGGIGDSQTDAHLLSFSQNGGIRTGIEDSIWFDKAKTIKATNASLIKRIHELAKISEKEMMTSADFKKYIRQK